MKKIFSYLFVILIVAALISAFTLPDDVKLKKEAAIELRKDLENKMDGFKFNFIERIAEVAVSNGISIDDYYIFKRVQFTFDGNTRTIGYGVFNSYLKVANK